MIVLIYLFQTLSPFRIYFLEQFLHNLGALFSFQIGAPHTCFTSVLYSHLFHLLLIFLELSVAQSRKTSVLLGALAVCCGSLHSSTFWAFLGK